MTAARLAVRVTVAVLLVAGSVAAQVHQGTPFVRALEPPTRGDEFLQPRAIHADNHTGEVFVSDSFNNRILIFDHRGFFRFQITGGAEFRLPTDLAVDERGFLYLLALARGHRGIIKMDFDGTILDVIPLTGLPEGARPPNLVSLALSTDGATLFALDEANKRLWIATTAGEVASSVDLAVDVDPDEIEELRFGHVDVYGDTVLLAVPTTGLIWMLDSKGKVRTKFGFKGTAACEHGFPVAAALDAEGKVLVLDKQRALYLRWDPESRRCLAEFSGFGNVPGALYQPGDLSLDDSGNIYVSQGFEGRVQVFRALAGAAPLLEAVQFVPTGELLAVSSQAKAESVIAGLEKRLEETESELEKVRAEQEKLAETATRLTEENSRLVAQRDTLLSEVDELRGKREVLAEVAEPALAVPTVPGTQSASRGAESVEVGEPAPGEREVEPSDEAPPSALAGARGVGASEVVSPSEPLLPPEVEVDQAAIEIENVEATVRAWAAAWARQEIGSYLSHYAASFSHSGGLSREAWERQRRERLRRPHFIEIGIEALEVELLGRSEARARFRQSYRSDRFSDLVLKSLRLVQEAEGWRIVREEVERTF